MAVRHVAVQHLAMAAVPIQMQCAAQMGLVFDKAPLVDLFILENKNINNFKTLRRLYFMPTSGVSLHSQANPVPVTIKIQLATKVNY